jgi:hypothetical protein
MNFAAFPKRPLGLAEGTGTARKIIVLLLSALFFTGCFAVFALALGPGVLEDIRLSKEGKLAVRGTVGGEIRTRLFVNWGDLKLEASLRLAGTRTSSSLATLMTPRTRRFITWKMILR